jgi:hypothetical protein
LIDAVVGRSQFAQLVMRAGPAVARRKQTADLQQYFDLQRFFD